MIQVAVHPSWSASFPGARMGLLEVHGLEPLATHPDLEQLRARLEAELRQRFAGMDRKVLKESPALKAYESHYKAFGKTYHVLQQIESVAMKGRPIPSHACAVTAMFMAELKHGILTAGHDRQRLPTPLTLGASTGTESYVNLSGAPCRIPPGDMMLCGPSQVISSVLYGPEQASPIQPSTRDALFTLYIPAACPPATVEQQRQDLTHYLQAFAPGAEFAWTLVPDSLAEVEEGVQ